MINEQFLKSTLLLGEDSLKKINGLKVALFGLGGVGSYVLEILARTGIQSFVLIDHDTINCTNINRQIIALHSTIGEYKVDVARKRVQDINLNAVVQSYKTFITDENIETISFDKCDYIIDAIDNLPAKVAIIKKAKKENIPIISCMGTGNKLDPMRFKITDISKSQMCPLAKKMRRLLKDEGIEGLKVIFSDESISFKGGGTIASAPFVPCVAGILIAREVIFDLL